MSEQLFCTRPFDWTEIVACAPTHAGKADDQYLQFPVCCVGWARRPEVRLKIEEAAKTPLNQIFNDPRTQALRAAVYDGSFVKTLCRYCPRAATVTDPVYPLSQVTDPYFVRLLKDKPLVIPGPQRLHLSCDHSCNLACPSCRNAPIHLGPGDAKYTLLNTFLQQQVRPTIVSQVKELFIAGMGDPFGSKLYFDLLQSLRPAEAPQLALYLHTNGLGFTPENYQKLAIREQIKRIQFSIDAATPFTYQLTRGGDWHRLISNLAFARSLLEAGKLQQIHMSFVIQQANWHEMPAFLELARTYGAELVLFYALQCWCNIPEPIYRARAVHLPGHPQHEAFKTLCHAVVTTTTKPQLILDIPVP